MTRESELGVISCKLSPVSMNDAVTSCPLLWKTTHQDYGEIWARWAFASPWGQVEASGSLISLSPSDVTRTVGEGGVCTERLNEVNEWDPISDCDGTVAWPPKILGVFAVGTHPSTQSIFPVVPMLSFLFVFDEFIACSSCELSQILSGTRWGRHEYLK